jgi:hypothetical protein
MGWKKKMDYRDNKSLIKEFAVFINNWFGIELRNSVGTPRTLAKALAMQAGSSRYR